MALWLRSFCPFARAVWENVSVRCVFSASSTLSASSLVAPFLDRMHASLLYYKGLDLRCERAAPAPRLRRWLDALGREDCYRVVRGDVHTHAHDLPPQMGGCYSSGAPAARELQRRVDLGLADAALRPEPSAFAPPVCSGAA